MYVLQKPTSLEASSGDIPFSNIIKVTPKMIQIPARSLNRVVDSIINGIN